MAATPAPLQFNHKETMQMLAFALTDAYAPFTISFMLMCGIGLIEALGLGLGSIDMDMDTHADVDQFSLLSWLGLGNEMPVLIWLTSLLGCFTLAGFGVQQTLEATMGQPLSWPIAVAAALPVALLLNLLAANGLHRILPRTETTAINTEALLGRRGVVIESDAAPGRPTRAKVVDRHGQAHYVTLLPHDDKVIRQGTEVLLVRREADTFYGITDDDTVG